MDSTFLPKHLKDKTIWEILAYMEDNITMDLKGTGHESVFCIHLDQ